MYTRRGQLTGRYPRDINAAFATSPQFYKRCQKVEEKKMPITCTIFGLLLLLCASAHSADDPGFNILIGTSVKDEVQNHEIKFQNTLPKWLKGSLIRNGPARYEMGNRKFLNLFDAFGKLNKWTFLGNGSAYFSTKFIYSNFYKKSLSENDIAAYEIFDDTVPSMSIEKSIIAMERGMDNMNINIYKLSDGCVILSDTWKLYSIDCHNLTTIKPVVPSVSNLDLGLGYVSQMSSAHPIPEIGTSNYFTFLTSMNIIPGRHHKISLIRIKSTFERESIAEFEIENAPYLHSFSATKNYIVLLVHPYYISVMDMLESGHPKDSILWHGDMPAMIYVVEIKTGKIHTFKTETVFFMHHVNAFEIHDSETKVVFDVAAYPNSDLVNRFETTTILNKAERDKVHWQGKLTRFTVNLDRSDVKVERFSSSPEVPFASGLDIPAINEKFRSRPYCHVYGLVYKSDNISFASFAYAKKDLCDPTGDRSWRIPGHYPMEGWFIPDPQGTAEDDGIIMMPVVDGVKKVSYLAILEARNLTLINKSDMPVIVPFHFHGRFFNDILL